MYALPKSALPRSPSLYQRLGRLYYRLFSQAAVKTAACLMTDSEYSRSDIARVFHISPERIRVIYLAATPTCRHFEDFTPVAELKQSYGINERFIFALGALDPRKNTLGVLRAFAEFKRLYTAPFQLVVIGLAQDAKTKFSRVVAEMGLSGQVVLLGFVRQEELVALYKRRGCFCLPISLRRVWHACIGSDGMWNSNGYILSWFNPRGSRRRGSVS